MGQVPHSSKLVICVVLLLFVLFYVVFVFVLSYALFVCKCVLYHCHRVSTQLQLTNISYISHAQKIKCHFQKNYLSQQFKLITQITSGEQYRSLSSSLCSFLHSPVTSSVLDPNILPSTLFSNTLSLRSSLNMSYQVSHPYKTRQSYSSVCLKYL